MILEIPVFVFMDKLPSVYDYITCIISYAPTHGSKRQKETVGIFAKNVEELWHRAFTDKHVIVRKKIKKRLENHLKDYATHVTKAKKGDSSKRQSLKAWQNRNNQLFDLLKLSSDLETFDNDERLFYQDQKAMLRKMALSDQIDEENEAECNFILKM